MNSFLGSFLEFISPIWFVQILFYLYFCLIKSSSNCQISQQCRLYSLEPTLKKSSKKQNLEKINWRIGENKFEKRSHEWVIYSVSKLHFFPMQNFSKKTFFNGNNIFLKFQIEIKKYVTETPVQVHQTDLNKHGASNTRTVDDTP